MFFFPRTGWIKDGVDREKIKNKEEKRDIVPQSTGPALPLYSVNA